MRHEGLESSNLILGIDFTKSNEWTGESLFTLQLYEGYECFHRLLEVTFVRRQAGILSEEKVCIQLAVYQIHMSKQFLLLVTHCLHLMMMA